MTKNEYIQNYIPSGQVRLAKHLLSDGDRQKAEWDQAWLRALNRTPR